MSPWEFYGRPSSPYQSPESMEAMFRFIDRFQRREWKKQFRKEEEEKKKKEEEKKPANGKAVLAKTIEFGFYGMFVGPVLAILLLMELKWFMTTLTTLLK